jgi:hypothetical protein
MIYNPLVTKHHVVFLSSFQTQDTKSGVMLRWIDSYVKLDLLCDSILLSALSFVPLCQQHWVAIPQFLLSHPLFENLFLYSHQYSLHYLVALLVRVTLKLIPPIMLSRSIISSRSSISAVTRLWTG